MWWFIVTDALLFAGFLGKVKTFLLLTVVGGLIFLSMQAIEWSGFIADGGRLHSNP